MHKFLRAVGFSKINNRKAMQLLITDCIRNASERDYVLVKGDQKFLFVECRREFADNIGIAVRGEFDDNNTYIYNYYFPFIRGRYISSVEDVNVERHAEKESYAGLCDDPRLGISLIFYLQNAIGYMKLRENDSLPLKGTSLTLSGLSIDGTVMMPIIKNAEDKKRERKASKKRSRLIAAARDGDEEAIENLTMEDMDTYSAISRMILNEDVFSLVDTYVMPYGVECDHYSVLGEITDCKKITNVISKEQLWLLTLNCNEMIIDVCINTEDLYGEPVKGRRFKGVIWMQGHINFPQ